MNSPGQRLKYVIPILLILILVAIGATLIATRESVIPPHIELQKGAPGLPTTHYSFPFEDATVTITGSVDPAVYYGAKSADKETRIRGNISEDIWLRDTYLAMINDPAQDSFYSSLINTLRSIRTQQHLDDDEYLDLLTVFVQSMPYESLAENPPKFPVETFVESSGDCDDKSLLLAGLLSREGYNVSLLSFAPEAHMAVGVACGGGEYKRTGYAFIETTNLSFVGVPTDNLGDDTRLLSDPLVTRVGNGTKTYTSCTESLYLDSVYTRSEERVTDLSAQIETLRERMDGYYAQRNVKNYNELVPVFNNLQKTRLKYAEIHNYILEHQYDRKGAYQYVKTNLSE